MSVITSERMLRTNPLRRLLVRPETGAVAGAIAVWIFFAIVAGGSGFLTSRGVSSYLSVSAELAIQAIPVALLMIGGEFDLSIGSTVGATGMIIAILSTQFGWNIWASIVVALIFAVLVGMLNGYLVIRTGLPSFIVTLGTAYILLGATTGITSIVTNGLTVVNGIDQAPGYSSAHAIFATALGGGQQFPIEILWALALVALATWLLLGTSFGNWIFGVGGDAHAARNIGVPVTRVKILLFIGTAVCSCLLAIILDVKFTNADVLRGQGNEFYAIVAAVVGGVLLTGGYGSAIGAMFGALVFGIVEEGIVFAGVNAEWYKAVIGLILLLAVLLNSYVRKLAMEARR
ncbi:MAG: ABC transporter permease [Chloroflexi bacterium]|nr:MAG: ABC transporter permease [Chloroflexota bacterium]TMC34949.1 MAG: ABC transporter permease [Chloroflexota bacterium]TMC90338.1 MAG: ABC transporter permease [Chloroflexota bacterium]TMD37933.1 MAG: ABC transporter permease [Chloroflexota bacterium]TMD75598.1 MAG: ABC transporter permease [Chloroflexota bacterium]